MNKIVLLVAAVLLAVVIAACGNNGGSSDDWRNDDDRNDDNRRNETTTYDDRNGETNGNADIGDVNIGGGEQNNERGGAIVLGDTFEFDDLAITLSSTIGFTRVQDRFSDYHGAYAFYIPVSILNIGDTSNGLSAWFVSPFSPAGHEISLLDWEFEDTSITRRGNVLPGFELVGNLYIPYAGNGEYILEFSDWIETIVVRFTLDFDFDAVPEVRTEFVLGDTLAVDNIYLHFGETVGWGQIDSRWSARDGERYFILTVTITNNSDRAAGFPWSMQSFGPDGHELDRIAWEVDNDDITRVGDMLPGATQTGYLHLHYTGPGQYTLLFDDRFVTGETLRLTFNIAFNDGGTPTMQNDKADNNGNTATNLRDEITGDVWQLDDDAFILYVFNALGAFMRSGPTIGFVVGDWTLDGDELRIELNTGEVERWRIGVDGDVLTLINLDDDTVRTLTRD